MGTVYPRGRRLWIGFFDPVSGRQRCVSSGLLVGQEEVARQLLAKVEALARQETTEPARTSSQTVAAFAEAWVKRRRARGVADAPNEAARLRLHALPRLGSMPVRNVKPRHLIALVDDLRAQGVLAPRTILGVYGTLRMLCKSAVIEEVIDASPAVLGRGQLPLKRDKDPSWRARAVYSRAELEMLVGSPTVPFDRRVLYALQGLAGLRIGEAVALRWSDYDSAAQPLGRLVVARSHAKTTTKTGFSREVPVHPHLSRILSE